MKRLLDWWYNLTLPQQATATTPLQREQLRYARLTSGFTLLLLALVLPIYPLMLFSPTPYGRYIGTVFNLALFCSLLAGKRGWRIVAGSLTAGSIIFLVSGMTLNTPLDPSFLTIFGSLAVATILAGSLLPPIASLIAGGINSVVIALIVLFHDHTPAFAALIEQRVFTVILFQPISIQVVIAVVTYVIMRTLVANIRRADRAEEISALQKELMERERVRSREKQQLEEGIQQIAQTHVQLANGRLDARVAIHEGNVLWSVAVPLNNFLNRAQRWKHDADRLAHTQQVSEQFAQYMRQANAQHQPIVIQQHTGTPLDPVLLELNRTLEQSSRAPGSPPRPRSY